MRISDWSSDVCSSDLFIVQKGPQGYQQMMAQAQQPQQQQAQDDPRIAQLQQTIVQMQEQQLAATIIDPFKRDHPRYAELEQDIAFFLQSGKIRSEEHTSELQSLMRISYAVFCLKKKIKTHDITIDQTL